MTQEDKARVHILVSGHVQGVGFRYFARDRAQQYDLTGWVRNRHDDRVEIMAEGNRSDLGQLIKDVNQGPTHATVTNLEIEWWEYAGNSTLFIIAPSE